MIKSTPALEAAHRPAPNAPWAAVLLIALVVTVLNAAKPVTMDDSAYFDFARQIAAHPLDPYGFRIIWSQWPVSAFGLLAPPVLPYWWALGIRLLGSSVVAWKLWLLPFVALFVGSNFVLLRRFSPGYALLLTVFTAFAPINLPALNLMLDIRHGADAHESCVLRRPLGGAFLRRACRLRPDHPRQLGTAPR